MFLGKDHKIKKSLCPFCEFPLDGASQVNGDNLPKPRDVSVCYKCGNISVFDDDLNLRRPTPKEEREFESDQTIIETQKAVFRAAVAFDLLKNFKSNIH